MQVEQTVTNCFVIGGVDTHKDLHVAAVVDEHDRVLGGQCFPTTRHGDKQMLAWMCSFGELRRVGVKATGSYGAGLLRYLQNAGVQNAGVEVLEVTSPDSGDRRKRGKNDDLDAQNAAHAAFAGKTTRHRLNRGSDRAANSALHIIAIGRLRTDPRTQSSIAKRIGEGHSKLEAIRCLKRYNRARYLLPHQPKKTRDQSGADRHLTNRRASTESSASRSNTLNALPCRHRPPPTPVRAGPATTPSPDATHRCLRLDHTGAL